MQYKLTSYWGDLYGREFMIDKVTLIGRFPQKLNNPQIAWLSRDEINPPNEILQQLIRVNHPDVSKNHVLIYTHNDQLKLRDLKSTNGTFVTCFRTEETVLENNKYFSLPKDERETLEKQNNIKIKDVKIKNPNNPAKLLDAKLISLIF